MSPGAGTSVPLRAQELVTEGPGVLEPLSRLDDLASRPAPERHEVLEHLRLELFAISAIVADATLHSARADRRSHPPYGLVRSMHSQSRMVVANPEPVPEGSIEGFEALGKAYIDTLVFFLDRQFKQLGAGEQAWLLERLDGLLALFRLDAGPATRSRMRDSLSFLYGGLHFGASVCVQLTQVMARMLAEGQPDMALADTVEVISRSSRPAYRMAAMNIDHVVSAYQRLQAPSGSPDAGWMNSERFVLRQSREGAWRIDLRDEETLDGRVTGRRFDAIPATYSTHGCPARSSPTGGQSAIAVLWSWCVELARDTGVLNAGRPGPRPDRGPS